MVYKSPYNNSYVVQRIGKDDLEFTKKKLSQYSFANKVISFSKKKLVAKFKPLNYVTQKFLKRYKQKINYKFMADVIEDGWTPKPHTYNIRQDFALNQLFVYDVLAKERLKDLEKGLEKFKEDNCAPYPFTLNRSKENFKELQKANSIGFFNIATLKIGANSKLNKFVEFIDITVEELEGAFDIITYTLALKQSATEEIKEILTSDIENGPIFSNRGSGFSSRLNLRDKKIAVDKLILEIKYLLMQELSQYVPCFLHSKNIIPPSMEAIYAGIPFDKDLLKLFNFNVITGQDETESKDYIEYDGVAINYPIYDVWNIYKDRKAIFINKDDKQADSWFWSCRHYHTAIAKLLIGETVSEVVDRLILEAQNKVNLAISKKSVSAKTLLKTKLNVYSEIYIFKLLVNTLNESYKRIKYKSWDFNEFKNEYLAELKIADNYNSLWGLKEDLQKSFDFYEKTFDDLFNVFDDKLRIVESSSNMRLIRFTLAATIFGVGISLIALLASCGAFNFNKDKKPNESKKSSCDYRTLIMTPDDKTQYKKG